MVIFQAPVLSALIFSFIKTYLLAICKILINSITLMCFRVEPTDCPEIIPVLINSAENGRMTNSLKIKKILNVILPTKVLIVVL
jgi:hypothetical protein